MSRGRFAFCRHAPRCSARATFRDGFRVGSAREDFDIQFDRATFDTGTASGLLECLKKRPAGTGTLDWRKHQVVIDVPEGSTVLQTGLLLYEKGEAWMGRRELRNRRQASIAQWPAGGEPTESPARRIFRRSSCCESRLRALAGRGAARIPAPRRLRAAAFNPGLTAAAPFKHGLATIPVTLHSVKSQNDSWTISGDARGRSVSARGFGTGQYAAASPAPGRAQRPRPARRRIL